MEFVAKVVECSASDLRAKPIAARQRIAEQELLLYSQDDGGPCLQTTRRHCSVSPSSGGTPPGQRPLRDAECDREWHLLRKEVRMRFLLQQAGSKAFQIFRENVLSSSTSGLEPPRDGIFKTGGWA